MEADFGSLEVRIAACYHQDPTMIKYIKDETTDMHRDMAQQIFKLSNFDKHNRAHGILRTAAKNGFVFPTILRGLLSTMCEKFSEVGAITGRALE